MFRRKDSVHGLKAIIETWWEGRHKHPRWKFNFDFQSSLLERNSLLNLAVRCGCRRTVRHLVEVEGVAVETTDDGGFTPLFNAAWRGDRVLVKYFLQRGADPVRRAIGNGCGSGLPMNAAEWAQHRGHKEVAEMLARRIKAPRRSAAAATDSEDAEVGASRGRKRRRAGGAIAVAAASADAGMPAAGCLAASAGAAGTAGASVVAAPAGAVNGTAVHRSVNRSAARGAGAAATAVSARLRRR
ncbi:unnamed protein product [Phaeothamnion confervicola]